MELIKLQLNTKNNKKNGFYLYTPIVKKDNLYYWCESIKTDKVLKPQDVSIEDLKIRREIPKEFYAANGIVPFEDRKPMFENDMCKQVGLIATCNACDRVIFEDEKFKTRFKKNGGYCAECDEEMESQ